MRQIKHKILLTLLVVAAASRAWAADVTIQFPFYTSASIVNAASYSADQLGPNVIATIYGTNLSYDTHALTANDLIYGGLPFSLEGVTIYIGGIPAGIYYVSPTQVNFLIPAIFLPLAVPISLARDTASGPTVAINLHPTAPALFADSGGAIIGTHLDGSLLSAQAPAKPGEWLVLYGLGFGATIPNSTAYALPHSIAPLADLSHFSVLINGAALDPGSIYYAGIAPGFAGLYQLNIQMPIGVSPNPSIQLVDDGANSQPSTYIPLS